MNLENKKVLLVGLGILGGGLSMAKYLIKNGARLTITDLRPKDILDPMIKQLPETIKYTLGKHLESDFDKAEIIIFNPAVPHNSQWVKYARKNKKEYYNDYTFFLKNVREQNPNALIIGITGTRGKTTTASWASHLIPGSILGGNIPERNLLKIMNKKASIFVLELSSFQLEYADDKHLSPDIAAVTNIYIDHLNRYKNFEKYRDIKLNIFVNQTENDALVLNYAEKSTKEALSHKPKAHLFFVSQKPLSKKKNGLFFDGDEIIYQYKGVRTSATKIKGMAPHEKANLLTAMMLAHLAGTEGKEINRLIKDLPQPVFRQQQVLKNRNFTVINDSAGTNPDATIAAIEKFKGGKNFILITGGTDKELDFSGLAQKIKKEVSPDNLFLLEGSGTNLLASELASRSFESMAAYENLEDIVDIISQKYSKGTVVFSPASASFEKFKNEFDRGQKFNKLVKKYFS